MSFSCATLVIAHHTKCHKNADTVLTHKISDIFPFHKIPTNLTNLTTH